MVLTALIAVVNLYGHGLQHVFSTTPIPGLYWGIPFAFAAGILMMDEIRKLIVRTYPRVSFMNFAKKRPIAHALCPMLLVVHCLDSMVDNTYCTDRNGEGQCVITDDLVLRYLLL